MIFRVSSTNLHYKSIQDKAGDRCAVPRLVSSVCVTNMATYKRLTWRCQKSSSAGLKGLGYKNRAVAASCLKINK